MTSCSGVLLAGTGKGVLRSTDHGASWEMLSGGPSSSDYSFTTVASTIYAGTFAGSVFRSMDFGSSWKDVSGGLPRTTINAFVSDGTYIMAATGGFGVWRRSLTDIASSVRDGMEWPTMFTLHQNYPNPFNPATTIRYSVPHRSQVLLKVYNTLGQQVATLVNGQQEVGSHEVKFDGSTLVTGVYFYGLQAGTFVETFTGGLFLLASGFCLYLNRLANRRGVCSQNPLRPRQTALFLIVLGLLGIYPGSWRDGMAGAILAAAFGMVFLFYSVALLSKAMFPCPDVPEKDLIDDLVGIYQILKPRSGYFGRIIAAIENGSGSSTLRRMIDLLNPRKHEWNLLALMAILMGFLLAFAEIFGEGQTRDVGQALLVAIVYIALESAGVFLGYALFRRFLGLIRSA